MPTTTQQAVIDPGSDNWGRSVTLAQIDPALGIESINLSLTGTIDSSVAVTSSEAGPSAFSTTDQGTVTLQQAGGASLIASPTMSYSTLLAPGSSASSVALTGSNTASEVFVPGAPASAAGAALIGTGQVQLPVTASARVSASGPGNLTADFATSLAATVTEVAVTNDKSSPANDHSIDGGNGTVGLPIIGGGGGVLAGSLTSAPQTVVLADQTTGSISNVTFGGLNPVLGQLEAVSVVITPDASGTVAAENLDPAAGSVTIGQAATIRLVTSDGTALATAATTASVTRSLAAYDGTAADSSFSATDTAAVFAASQLPGTNDTALFGADTAPFISAQPVTFAALLTGATTINGPGNLSVATTLQAGATITISYIYYPGGTTLDPTPTPNLITAGQTRTLSAGDPALTVGAHGTLIIPAGRFTTAGILVDPLGTEIVQSGASVSGANTIGVASNGTLGGASLVVQAGGTINNATVGVSSTANISGTAVVTAVTGGLLTVAAGGSDESTSVTSGTEIVAGTSSGAKITGTGVQVVGAGGATYGTSVSAFGSVDVQAGGTAFGITIGKTARWRLIRAAARLG